MKKTIAIILFICVLLIVIISAAFIVNKKNSSKKIHYHAGFVVFKNNKKIDLSDSKYMYISPCVLDGKHEESDESTQIEKAHLHDGVGDVVHVERGDAKWGDLFENIKYPINYNDTKAYLNGNEFKDFQNTEIKPEDSIVIFIGKNDKKLISQAVSKEYMDKMASQSKDCGD